MTREHVLAIYKAQSLRYTGRDLLQATRTEVNAALHLEQPAPYSDHPKHLPKDRSGSFKHSEKAEIDAHQRAQVTDKEIVASERARMKDPGHLDAHHYVQKEHGKKLWELTDKFVREAGIGEGSSS